MKTGKAGLELIKSFEGYLKKLPDGSCKAYWDKYGRIWTIGWGCTEGVYDGMVLTRNQAEKFLQKELAKHERNVLRWIKVPLNQNQFDALVSLSYNVGISPTRTRALVEKLNAKDYEGAAKAILSYRRSGGVVLKGLVRRRQAEKELFETPTSKDVIKNSSKLTWLQRIRNFFAVTFTGWFTADSLGIAKDWLETFKDILLSNSFLIIVGSGLSLWLLLKWIEYKSIQDYEERRYVPSGMVEDV